MTMMSKEESECVHQVVGRIHSLAVILQRNKIEFGTENVREQIYRKTWTVEHLTCHLAEEFAC